MKRAHRTVHRTIWPALALLVGGALAMALILRAPPSNPPASVERLP
jgi:hypothetical protein